MLSISLLSLLFGSQNIVLYGCSLCYDQLRYKLGCNSVRMLLKCSLFLALNVPAMGMVLIQMFIHILQLWFEVTLQLRPLHLECGRQQTVLYGKWIRMQVYILDLSG